MEPPDGKTNINSSEMSCGETGLPRAETHFAPAERADNSTIRAQSSAVSETPNLLMVLNALPHPAFVINNQRQILGGNQALLSALGATGIEGILGQRPGEALGCKFAFEGPGGCGTSKNCQTCGAVRAILNCLSEQTPSTEECHLRALAGQKETSLDLSVTASPLTVNAQAPMSLVTIMDISAQNRRNALERIFFHDVINSLGGIKGLLDNMAESTQDPTDAELAHFLANATEFTLEDVQDFDRLAKAELGELRPNFQVVDAQALLNEVGRLVANHENAFGVTLVQLPFPANQQFESDPALLRRVLINLIKNACEASQPGQKVTLSCEFRNSDVVFEVHNESVMPEKVKLQIFQRSFSTKGAGRGVGTYSIKLLTTQYLGGQVSFKSEQGLGTTFSVYIPLGAKQ
jgi:nitrogen fixation/metabolism regulation signal transduction histidine kinase